MFPILRPIAFLDFPVKESAVSLILFYLSIVLDDKRRWVEIVFLSGRSDIINLRVEVEARHGNLL